MIDCRIKIELYIEHFALVVESDDADRDRSKFENPKVEFPDSFGIRFTIDVIRILITTV